VFSISLSKNTLHVDFKFDNTKTTFAVRGVSRAAKPPPPPIFFEKVQPPPPA